MATEPITEAEIACPFCGEKDFDLFGLKLHFINGWCDVFNVTTDSNYESHAARVRANTNQTGYENG